MASVRRYRHSSTHPYSLDLRAFGQGRKFFKTKAEAEAERLRQIILRERGGREAVGLPLNELAAIVEARSTLAKHGKSICVYSRYETGLPRRLACLRLSLRRWKRWATGIWSWRHCPGHEDFAVLEQGGGDADAMHALGPALT